MNLHRSVVLIALVLALLALALVVVACGGEETTTSQTVTTTTSAMASTTSSTPIMGAQAFSYDELATSPEDATTGFDGTVAAAYGPAIVVYFDGNEDQPVHVNVTYNSGGFAFSIGEGRKVHVLAHPRGTSEKYAADFSLPELPRVLALKVERLEDATDTTTTTTP